MLSSLSMTVLYANEQSVSSLHRPALNYGGPMTPPKESVAGMQRLAVEQLNSLERCLVTKIGVGTVGGGVRGAAHLASGC